MNQGNIILLNGTSSAGKSTTAKALQEAMDAPYLHWGIDYLLERLSLHRLCVQSDGITPSSADGWLFIFQNEVLVELRMGPVGYKLIAGMYHAIAALAHAGIDVILDDVLYDPHVLRMAVEILPAPQVFFVGIKCPLEVVERREQERGDRAKGTARTFHDLVHRHGIYDLEVDSAALSPAERALRIKQGLPVKPSPDAFAQLRSIFADEAL